MAIAPAPSDPLSSAAALIRSLKSPTLSSSAKIDIALAAWSKEDLYIPAKRGLFMDWAVGVMGGPSGGQVGKKGKEREKEGQTPCVFSSTLAFLSHSVQCGVVS